MSLEKLIENLNIVQNETPRVKLPSHGVSRRRFILLLSGVGVLVTLEACTPKQLPNSQTPPITTPPLPTQTTTQPLPVSLTQLSFRPSWHAGETDINGKPTYATEIMRVLPHNGKLFASTSMWMENDSSIAKACQLLVLDGANEKWKVFHQFTTRNLRLVSLQTVPFTTDAQGRKIVPVEMLLTAPDTVGVGGVQVFSLNDKTNELEPMSLGLSASSYASTRAIGWHHDSKTGVDLVFAGNDVLGLFSGGYDPSIPGRIKWQSSPELVIPAGERAMGFAVCNNDLYCATSNHIYKRSDGASPSWLQVYYDSKETNAVGIRGLTAVQNPSGKGEVLLFRSSNIIRHIDPANNNRETVELDVDHYLSNLWNTTITFNICAYNDFLPYTIPGTGEMVHLFGFEAEYSASAVVNNPQLRVFKTPGGNFVAEGRYLIRHVTDQGLSFEVGEVKDGSLPTLESVRTIAVSPFPGDNGQVFYFGGFDCNSQPSHNTGWIYRGAIIQ